MTFSPPYSCMWFDWSVIWLFQQPSQKRSMEQLSVNSPCLQFSLFFVCVFQRLIICARQTWVENIALWLIEELLRGSFVSEGRVAQGDTVHTHNIWITYISSPALHLTSPFFTLFLLFLISLLCFSFFNEFVSSSLSIPSLVFLSRPACLLYIWLSLSPPPSSPGRQKDPPLLAPRPLFLPPLLLLSSLSLPPFHSHRPPIAPLPFSTPTGAAVGLCVSVVVVVVVVGGGGWGRLVNLIRH